MTDLFLLRHAHAGDASRWQGDDASRPLSDKGRRQAERLGALLATIDDAPDLFLTSPRVRAAETAELAAKPLKARVEVDERLGGPLGIDVVDAILDTASGARRPCLVGHDPDFSEILAELLGVPTLPMRKGAIARLDVRRPLGPGSAVLRWLLPPEVVPGR